MAQRTYDDAIDALNSLQTSFKVLEERRKAGTNVPDASHVQEMRMLLKAIGHTSQDLERLNIVHVAGTKGKGSVCAFVDSILSHTRKTHGKPTKTGLYTSPHLVSVRERIRINSTPISDVLFAKYFFDVWDLLIASGRSLAPDAEDKPTYFRYLTLLSFHIFLKEGVEVAVYEVGVGGEYDATNIIDRPAVTGITTLEIDHVAQLGNTIESIAWHKAGIMKKGSPAFTVVQVPQAMEVVKKRAVQKDVDLRLVEASPLLQGVKVLPDAEFQRRNASLALELTSTVLTKIDPTFSMPEDHLPQTFVDGIEKVVWRGRCEIKREGSVTWYLDGAHTVQSLKVAAQWFAGEVAKPVGKRVLIYNQQSRTEAASHLKGLFTDSARFDQVIFCTNVTYGSGYKKDFVNHMYDSEAISKLTVQKEFAEQWKSLHPSASVVVLPTIQEALDHARSLSSRGSGEPDVRVLVTGSLHLVGGAIGVLEGIRS